MPSDDGQDPEQCEGPGAEQRLVVSLSVIFFLFIYRSAD